MPDIPPVVMQPVETLTPHPMNYRGHPEDEIEHIKASILANGVYKNVVTARDLTILAGHGVVQACVELGVVEVPVVRLDLDRDDPRALKILAGDNEIARLGEVDDRALTDLLKRIVDAGDADLLGTGFDRDRLAMLALATRPAEEIPDFDAAREWVGLPVYEEDAVLSQRLCLIVYFPSVEEREDFLRRTEIPVTRKVGRAWSTSYPHEERRDIKSVRFEEASS